MKFELDHQDIHFIISLTPSSMVSPSFYAEDDHLSSFDILIQSSQGSVEMTHLSQGVILSNQDEQDLMEEIENWLDEQNVIDHILHHWELEFRENLKTEWA